MIFTTPSRRGAMWLLLGASASLLAACQPELVSRGYRPKAGALGQVGEGMSKTEVESIMGSPTNRASIEFEGDSYYYVSSTGAVRSFLPEKEVQREVIAIRFSREETVTSVAQYAFEDGRVFNLSDRRTPVVGQELNILQELLGGRKLNK